MNILALALAATMPIGDIHFTVHCSTPLRVVGHIKNTPIDLKFEYIIKPDGRYAQWRSPQGQNKDFINHFISRIITNRDAYQTCDQYNIKCSHIELGCKSIKT